MKGPKAREGDDRGVSGMGMDGSTSVQQDLPCTATIARLSPGPILPGMLSGRQEGAWGKERDEGTQLWHSLFPGAAPQGAQALHRAVPQPFPG